MVAISGATRLSVERPQSSAECRHPFMEGLTDARRDDLLRQLLDALDQDGTPLMYVTRELLRLGLSEAPEAPEA